MRVDQCCSSKLTLARIVRRLRKFRYGALRYSAKVFVSSGDYEDIATTYRLDRPGVDDLGTGDENLTNGGSQIIDLELGGDHRRTEHAAADEGERIVGGIISRTHAVYRVATAGPGDPGAAGD